MSCIDHSGGYFRESGHSSGPGNPDGLAGRDKRNRVARVWSGAGAIRLPFSI